MGLKFRKAKRSSAKPLIGFYGESGVGKTLSALMLARGFVGPDGKIVMIETESGRGEVYADTIPGGYHVVSMTDDYSSKAYGQAISMAEKEGAQALVIDSGSHEWEGIGGVLDAAEKNKQAGKKAMLVWQQPKIDHQKHFIGRLLQTPIDLVILCMRAKYPMEQQMVKGKKEWVRSETLVPIQDERILYEMMNHGWIDHQHRFHGQKFALPEVKQILSEKPITYETGAELARWARGEVKPQQPTATPEALIAGIEMAETAEELKSVGAQVKAAGYTRESHPQVLEAYRARSEELK